MRAIRIGICIAVAFAVLAHGAVEAWSEAALVILAAVLLGVWCLRALVFHRTELHLPAFLLPVFLLTAYALAQWLLGISVYPYLTRVEFLKLAAYLAVLFLAAQVFRNLEEFRPFLWFLLFFGFLVALFGILQHLTFNGKLYWLRELSESGYPFGPYVNRNHFAGLMELIAPLGMALLLFRGVPRDQLPVVGLLTVFPVAALFLSASRGGVVSFLFQLLLLGILSWTRQGRKRALALGLIVLLFASAFVFWIGVVPTWQRFQRIEAGEVVQNRRTTILKDSWRIVRDYPWLGTGLGTFETVYRRYESYYDGKVVNHAHNDYIELMVETGAVGTLCAAAFLFLLYRRALFRRGRDDSPFAAGARLGALVACSGLLLHGLVDFNLRIPSNALLFLLLAWLAASPWRQAPVIPLAAKVSDIS
jgi:O-antigen ligase